jgi:hypothetical protein
MFHKRGISAENIPKCGFKKIVDAWLAKTEVLPEGYSWQPRSLKNLPMPFEIEFNMSNRFDCQDWLNDNGIKLNESATI